MPPVVAVPFGAVSHPDGRICYVRPHDSEAQLGLFAAPRRLFTCTPSKLVAFEDCPRRYRFTYVDRPAPRKGPPWAHNSLGVSVHAALRAWYGLPADRRPQSSLERILRAGWLTEGYRDDTQETAAFRMALGWCERYVEGLDPAAEPVGIERVVAAKTSTMAFSGRVDRIDHRPEGLVIVDYKTGSGRLTADDARGSRAMALYAFAAERVFRQPCRQVELHHLPTGAVAVHEHSEESLARHVRRSEETAADAVEAEASVAGGGDPDQAFPAVVGPRCSWCDYRRVCAAGASSPPREPWAAVESRMS